MRYGYIKQNGKLVYRRMPSALIKKLIKKSNKKYGKMYKRLARSEQSGRLLQDRPK